MPVTSVGSFSAVGPGSQAAPAAPAAPAPAARPLGDVVGHGVTRLMVHPPSYAPHPRFVPGAPPPTQETAGAHGAHKGRISIR